MSMIRICEIFSSIQGESTFAGLPCTFVRLGGCNLRCSYCDTAYAQEGGEPREVDAVVADVLDAGLQLVAITGGEPLMQAETPLLCERLLRRGRRVLVETNGSMDIGVLPAGVVRVMDIKAPGSGMADRFLDSNIDRLKPADECKFVLIDRVDFVWAMDVVERHRLAGHCTVIFAPVWNRLPPAQLAEWILQERLPVRLGLQLHKVLWGDERQR
jgi:7-carboxy-7-deazaguanine synthase